MRHITLCILFLFSFLPATSQVIISNGFEERDRTSSTGLSGWNNEGNEAYCSADSIVKYKGNYSMQLSRTAATGKSFFHHSQAFTCTSLKKYIISCAVKTENLKGSAGMGVRLFDKNGNSVTGYNAFTVTETKGWKIAEGEFYADETVVSMRIFGNVEGSGKAWFDEITIKEIPLSAKSPGKATVKYIAEYFEYVHKYSIVKDTAYLALLETNTLRLCAGRNDAAYRQDILKRYTTLKLNDGHSFFFTTADWKSYRKGSQKTIMSGLVNYPTGRMTNEHVAYINVPTFASLDATIIQKYVDSLQTIISDLDRQNPKGWIIDLSGNMGGNSFAMLVGLGPLLGNGICGYSESADGTKRTRVYNNGCAGWYPDTTFIQRTPVYQLIHKDLPVAVIYGPNTGSAGEVTAISFRGKENTKSFGQETYGATTRVDNLELSDGASLNLACGWDADRTGFVYKTKVPPDIRTEDHDQALAEAIKWILAQ
jgi:hypothetical protein